MNFNNQLQIIEGIIQGDDVDTRVDCPFCNHTNTLTIKKSEGKVMWYCFHASCNAKGNIKKEMSMKDVEKSILLSSNADIKKKFFIPENFVSVYNTDKCTDYMKKNHCMVAYMNGLVDMKYDVRQHRAVFLIKKDQEVVGAVGRGLNSEVYPKWFMYGDKSYPFMCGKHDTAIIVEDCASACAVSDFYCGVALMGTSLPESYIPVLKKHFKKVIIALDRDATTKAFDISNQLRYYMDTQVKILEEDLKYFGSNQIEGVLK
tara:strand:+ start:47 stop:826 length:780 start_codon:yes stop_codon:yes gene_type:complete